MEKNGLHSHKSNLSQRSYTSNLRNLSVIKGVVILSQKDDHNLTGICYLEEFLLKLLAFALYKTKGCKFQRFR